MYEKIECLDILRQGLSGGDRSGIVKKVTGRRSLPSDIQPQITERVKQDAVDTERSKTIYIRIDGSEPKMQDHYIGNDEKNEVDSNHMEAEETGSEGVMEHALHAHAISDEARRRNQQKVLLDVQHLTQVFPLTRKLAVKAVDDVSFEIRRGEIFGLVGESGSGKSTVARCIMNIYHPQSGKILYEGLDTGDRGVFRRNRKLLQTTRQIIFQDSASSLNQRMKVVDIVTEPMKLAHQKLPRGSFRAEAEYQLKYVGLDASILDKYPSELYGGQRQRVSIARAVIMEPELLIADEPIASLDVSIQAQIVNLFRHLQRSHGFSFLFIAHDLAMVEFLCDRVGVMYHGRLVEVAPCKELYQNPQHPYTKALLSAIPTPDPRRERSRKPVELDENMYAAGGELREVLPGHFVAG